MTSARGVAVVQAVRGAQKLSSLLGTGSPLTYHYSYGIDSTRSSVAIKTARAAQNLSADAIIFKPKHDDKDSPVKYLHCNSSPDDQPTIVNSSSAVISDEGDKSGQHSTLDRIIKVVHRRNTNSNI